MHHLSVTIVVVLVALHQPFDGRQLCHIDHDDTPPMQVVSAVRSVLRILFSGLTSCAMSRFGGRVEI